MKKIFLFLLIQFISCEFAIQAQTVKTQKLNHKNRLKNSLIRNVVKAVSQSSVAGDSILTQALENKYQCATVPAPLSVLFASVQLTGTTIVNDQTIALSNQIGKQITSFTNQYRASKGVPPLVWDPKLALIGRGHTLQMARGVAPFDHTGFNTRFNRYLRIYPNTRSFGENLFYGFGFTASQIARVAVNGWISSPGHERNLRGNFNRTGVAAFRNVNNVWYITQLFALR